jgi:glycerol-3-phosphate acyltransferase PlsY
LNYGTIIQPDWQFQLIIMIIIIYCAILITIRHRENIIRIFSKQERKIF